MLETSTDDHGPVITGVTGAVRRAARGHAAHVCRNSGLARVGEDVRVDPGGVRPGRAVLAVSGVGEPAGGPRCSGRVRATGPAAAGTGL